MAFNLNKNENILKYVNTKLSSYSIWASKNKWKIISAFILATGILAAGIPKFTLNQSMNAFFSDDDPVMMEHQWFKYLFGSDEAVVVMYQPKSGDIFSKNSLENVMALEERLQKERLKPDSPLNRITRIRSIISADYLETQNDELINRPFIGANIPKNQHELTELKEKALKHKDYPGLFFSKDAEYGMIQIQTDFGSRIIKEDSFKKNSKDESIQENSEDEFDFGDEESAAELISIENVPKMEAVPMDEYVPFDDALMDVFKDLKWEESNTSYYAGNPVIMSFFGKVIMKEIGVFSLLSIVIIWIVMLIAFRSLAAIVWPTLLLLSGILWIIGIIGHSGIEMTFMINIIIYLLLATSIATSIHVLSGYKYFLKSGNSPLDSLTRTYHKSGMPIILAAITTSIGLFSMYFVPIPAIKNFGLFAGVGVLLSLIINLAMWPTFISLWAPKIKENKEKKEGILSKFLSHQQERANNNKILIIATFIAITGFAAAGIPKVFIDTNFIEMIKKGFPITESYKIIDEHFGGTASAEILINTGAQDGAKDPKILHAVERLTLAIKNKFPELTKRQNSMVKPIKESHKNLSSGKESDYIIPNTVEKTSQVAFSFESADPATRKLMVDDNWQVIRLNLSLITKGTNVYADFSKEIMSMAEKEFSQLKGAFPKLELKFVGSINLMTKLLNLVSVSQIRSFSLALGVISILLFFLFASVKFGILAMIPNIFPLVVVMGAAGWFGIPLDSDTLLVIPIAIGIAVDDTIHFLTHYKSELSDGLSSEQAMNSAIKKVGQAMIFTTVVLSAGFLVFVLSSYQPLTNFGILSSLAFTFALFADLFLLPVLIRMFASSKKTTGQ